MSKFKVGDKVVLINVDRYHNTTKQLIGKTLLVRSEAPFINPFGEQV